MVMVYGHGAMTILSLQIMVEATDMHKIIDMDDIFRQPRHQYQDVISIIHSYKHI
jgi:hypothetical protein